MSKLWHYNYEIKSPNYEIKSNKYEIKSQNSEHVANRLLAQLRDSKR